MWSSDMLLGRARSTFHLWMEYPVRPSTAGLATTKLVRHLDSNTFATTLIWQD